MVQIYNKVMKQETINHNYALEKYEINITGFIILLRTEPRRHNEFVQRTLIY